MHDLAVQPVWVDILKKRNSDDFEPGCRCVRIGTKATSTVTVMFPISMEYPANQIYYVEQRTTGSFRSIIIGDRSSVETEHTLKFKPSAPATDGHKESPLFWYEFVLADKLISRLDGMAGLVPDGQPGVAAPSTIAGFDINEPTGVPPATATGAAPTKVYYNTVLPDLAKRATPPLGDAMINAYTVNTTGRVSVVSEKVGTSDESLTFGNGENTVGTDPEPMEPELVFTVSGVGAGTIEIGYHVWWDEDGPTVPASGGNPATATKKAKWHFATETLTVTVIAVK